MPGTAVPGAGRSAIKSSQGKRRRILSSTHPALLNLPVVLRQSQRIGTGNTCDPCQISPDHTPTTVPGTARFFDDLLRPPLLLAVGSAERASDLAMRRSGAAAH